VHHRLCVGAAWFTLVALTASVGYAADLPSYEAVYDLRLTQASSSGGPRAATGLYETRFVQTCTGWDTKTHTIMNLAFSDGGIFTNERFFSSWESKNSRDYTFGAYMFKNGELVESYKGAAELSSRGGRVRYEVPGPEGRATEYPADGKAPQTTKKPGRVVSMMLPQGTMFPAAHQRALLGSAQKGGPLFSSFVLSGSAPTGLRILSTAISPSHAENETGTPEIDAGLLRAPSWRMSAAYFNANEKRDVPNFETFMQVHGSGVTESFDQTFGDFTVSARLVRLRKIDPPTC
jgi:hypothetical protein